MKSISSDVCERLVSAGARAWGRALRVDWRDLLDLLVLYVLWVLLVLAEIVDWRREDLVPLVGVGLPGCEDVGVAGPVDLINSAISRVESRVGRASLALPVDTGDFGGAGMREEMGMNLGESADLVRPREVRSPFARVEREVGGRASSPGGAVFFKKLARSCVSAVSDLGIGRGGSGNWTTGLVGLLTKLDRNERKGLQSSPSHSLVSA